MLINIDISQRLPECILVSLKVQNRNINESFFIAVHYEQLPRFCEVCKAIGHAKATCNKITQLQRKEITFNMRRMEMEARSGDINSGKFISVQREEDATQQSLGAHGKHAMSDNRKEIEEGANCLSALGDKNVGNVGSSLPQNSNQNA